MKARNNVVVPGAGEHKGQVTPTPKKTLVAVKPLGAKPVAALPAKLAAARPSVNNETTISDSHDVEMALRVALAAVLRDDEILNESAIDQDVEIAAGLGIDDETKADAVIEELKKDKRFETLDIEVDEFLQKDTLADLARYIYRLVT